MNEELSIGTDTACTSDVALTAPSDADESVLVNVRHLSIEPEHVARFREQIESQKSSKKETEEFSTVDDEQGNAVLRFTNKPQAKSALSELSSQNKGKFQPFHAKPEVKFDIKSPIAPSQTLKNTNDVQTVSAPMTFCETLKSAETASKDISLDNTPSEKQTNNVHGTEKTPQKSFSAFSQPSQTLKSPTTLLRELSAPSVSTYASGTTSKTSSVGTGKSNVARPSGNGSNAHQTEISNFDATRSAQKPPLKAKNCTSTAIPAAEKSERRHASENTSDTHKTAVIDTIPFLRTANETIAPVSDPNAAQASKSHATLIAQQIRDHIIDRILVSSSALNTQKTVTVQLSPRLLQDTEVQFTQNGTSLDIRLVSQNKDSVQFLQQHQSDLQTYLQGELKTYRAISVRVPSSQTSSELSQPHDGRSRNRFDYQSADEEETT